MRLIVHIGTEKTGSTAIQEHLLANREALAERGAHLCESAGEGNHRALVAAFMPDDFHDDFLRTHGLEDASLRAAWRSGFLEAFAAEVAAAKAEADVFVVSSEHFHSRLLQPDSVRQLAAFLSALFSDISVICYLRRQDEMALSFYSEKLRAGFIPPSILPLANVRRRAGSLPPFFDFESLLARWGRAFGADRVMPQLYQADSLVNGDVVQDFFQIAGLGTPGVSLPEATNPSLCLTAQAALRLFNQHCGGNDVVSRDIHRSTRLALVDYLQSQNRDDRGQLPARVEARAFYQAFVESNTRVARQWFQRESLFNEDFSAYPDTPQPIDWADTAELLAGFVTEQGVRAASAASASRSAAIAAARNSPAC